MAQQRMREQGGGGLRSLRGAVITGAMVAGLLAGTHALTRAAAPARPLGVPINPTPGPIPNTHTVPATATVSVTYSEPISAATVSTRTFAVHGMYTGLLAETYGVSGSAIVLTPTHPFKPGELVQVSATTGTLSGIDGQGPISPTVWQFRVAAGVAQGVFADTGQVLGEGESHALALGDVDGDGDLDAFVGNYNSQMDAGEPNEVWVNQGGVQGGRDGIFVDSGQRLGDGESHTVALGDLDGDGDLDAFVGNGTWDIGESDRVWLNDGMGVYTDSGQSLDDGVSQAVVLGDVDGDGDLDALVGYDDWQCGGGGNAIWLNDGSGVFNDSGHELGTRNSHTMALGDVDGDGDLDAFVGHPCGWEDEVWLNGGLGVFSDSGQRLGNFSSDGVVLGDVDGDGDLDAVVVGEESRVWENDGDGMFSDTGQSLGSASASDVALGDVDGDGDLDILMGRSGRGNQVWVNDGSGVFSDSGQEMDGSGMVALGDLGGDGDLDTFLGNVSGQGNKVWMNRNTFRVTEVSPPNGAFDVARDTTVSATVNSAVDFNTVSTRTFTVRGNQTGMYLGTYSTDSLHLDLAQDFKPGEEVVVHLSSGIESITGTALVPYAWGFRASAGVAQGVFADTGQVLGEGESHALALGDVDGDGDLDAFVGNYNPQMDAGEPNEVWVNQGGVQGGRDGIFVDSGQRLGDGESHTVALGDLDGDGDLDAFVGNGTWDIGESDRVWLNDGTGVYTDSGQSLGNGASQAVVLGDVDGDGDLDALVGYDDWQCGGGGNAIWLNDGSGVFNDSGHELGSGNSHTMALGDVDGDGDLDAFVGHTCGWEDEVWLNGGLGVFSDSGQRLGNFSSDGVALGDVDGDGDLDAVVVGGESRVWENDGDGVFSDSGQSLGISNAGDVVLGDVEGDGDLDVLVGRSGRANQVWLNDGSGVFSNSGQEMDGSGMVALGDLDGDGDLDMFLGNVSGQGNKVWMNRNTFRVTEVSPPNGAFDVARDTTVSATVNSAVDFNTVSTRTFTVRGNQTGMYLGTYSTDSLHLDLAQDFKPGEEVVVHLSSGIESITGTALVPYVWGFRASAGVAQGVFADTGQVLGEGESHALALGDVDGDGDLDAFVGNYNPQMDAGEPNEVWVNQGGVQGGRDGIFVDSGQRLGDGESHTVALGDLDGDGDLDAFVGNGTWDIGESDRVWLNDGMGVYTDSGQSLDDGVSQAVVLGDVDGDGDLDALVGYDDWQCGGGGNAIWLNDGSGVFNDSGHELGSGNSHTMALGDVDGDGDLDAFVGHTCGWEDEVWLNGGLGVFSDSGQRLGNFSSDGVALGDVDGDGDLDAVVVGGESRVWENDGDGVFSDSGQSLGISNAGDVVLGDVEGDGDLDVLVGRSGRANQVWLNDGSGVFSNSGQEMDGSGIVALGDLDGDGDLDAYFGTGGANKVWVNQNAFRAMEISPPNGGLDVASDATISATFSSAVDFGSVSAGTFTVRGSQTGVYAGVYITGGTLLLPDRVLFDPAEDLKPGEEVVVNLSRGLESTGGVALAPYAWGFRAAVGSGAGEFVDSGQVLGSSDSFAVALGDLDGDGDLDGFVGNYDAQMDTGQPNEVWLHQGGTYTDSGQRLGNSTSIAVVLGDLDGDGDLDAFVGNSAGDTGQPNEVWLNDGSGVFTDSGQSLGDSMTSGMALGDVDGDGDLDAFTANGAWHCYNEDNKVWLNDGSGVFNDSGQALGGWNSNGVALGDVDGDGDLDAFVTNRCGQPSTVWLNGGLGVFVDGRQSLGDNEDSQAVALGDLDGDGDLDAYVGNAWDEPDTVWLNDGSGVFSDSGQDVGDSDSTSVALGDLDGDGDLDAVVGNWSQGNRVWLNDGAGAFSHNEQSLGGLDSTSVALGDVDGDGDLDLFVGNDSQYGAEGNRVWLNEYVTHEPDVTVSPRTLTARLNPDDTANRTLVVGNQGTTNLAWSLAESPAAPWFSQLPYDGILMPASNRELLVSFDAMGLGADVYTTTLQVLSNDPDEPQVDVDVTLVVTSACIPPSGAEFGFSPTVPEVDQPAIFLGSVEEGSKPIAYTWAWNDGSAAATDNPAVHAFPIDGSFVVTMTASNGCGSSVAARTINVSRAPFGEHEPNDICVQARPIDTDGSVQLHTFYQEADNDWVTFDGVAGTTYLVEARATGDSPADVSLELYDQCGGDLQGGQDYVFSPDVRLEFEPPSDGPIYLRFVNDQAGVFGAGVAYELSVRGLGDTPTPGVLILVAGRLKENDPLQDNIHHVTDEVYRLFVAHGYTHDRIHYLATDLSLDGYDDAATVANLGAAITSWAQAKVGVYRPLTLFMMDHGGYDKLYLDKPDGHWVTPAQIDGWLAQLEDVVPGLKVNVIIEACNSGSFIDPDQRLTKQGRVVVTSTGADNPAWASDLGAVFSDHFVEALGQGTSLYSAFQIANSAVQSSHPTQTPWLDDNGNEVANESSDGEEAARRGFTFAGTLPAEAWPPYIVQAFGPPEVVGGQGVIRAEVRDDEGVNLVWAVVYPPSYEPPETGEEMVQEPPPNVVLVSQGNDVYAATYTGFDEEGTYRIVIYAKDYDGLEGRPKQVLVGYQVYLPLVFRNGNPW